MSTKATSKQNMKQSSSALLRVATIALGHRSAEQRSKGASASVLGSPRISWGYIGTEMMCCAEWGLGLQCPREPAAIGLGMSAAVIGR